MSFRNSYYTPFLHIVNRFNKTFQIFLFRITYGSIYVRYMVFHNRIGHGIVPVFNGLKEVAVDLNDNVHNPHFIL